MQNRMGNFRSLLYLSEAGGSLRKDHFCFDQSDWSKARIALKIHVRPCPRCNLIGLLRNDPPRVILGCQRRKDKSHKLLENRHLAELTSAVQRLETQVLKNHVWTWKRRQGPCQGQEPLRPCRTPVPRGKGSPSSPLRQLRREGGCRRSSLPRRRHGVPSR